jgi:predicted O-methyltransferase YrrM
LLSKGLDDIVILAAQDKYLSMVARLTGSTNVFEIGTCGASSSVWLAMVMPLTKVTSIEVDPHAFLVV